MSTCIHKFKNGPKKGTLCGRNIRSKKGNVTMCHEHKPKLKKGPIEIQPVNDQTEIIDVNDEIIETIFKKDHNPTMVITKKTDEEIIATKPDPIKPTQKPEVIKLKISYSTDSSTDSSDISSTTESSSYSSSD